MHLVTHDTAHKEPLGRDCQQRQKLGRRTQSADNASTRVGHKQRETKGLLSAPPHQECAVTQTSDHSTQAEPIRAPERAALHNPQRSSSSSSSSVLRTGPGGSNNPAAPSFVLIVKTRLDATAVTHLDPH
ncbi:hypothetical protein Pelo_19373 [Pelomyxa schiedti]|nr:hypothetical protein Pelo_19373 [Pelomyxa schiedti]